MKGKILLISTTAIILIWIMLLSGCTTRHAVPVIDRDSTSVYLPQKEGDIVARITLCRKISKKTGRLIGEGTAFHLGKEESVRALIQLENHIPGGNRDLMIHFDWIDHDENSVFTKKIYVTPDDTATSLMSSISLSPENRLPGEYLFRVFLFRELIAEKKFRVLPPDTIPITDRFSADITLCRKIDKKTGELTDVDSVFEIKEKGRITAVTSIRHLLPSKEQELILNMIWVGPDGKSFYSKELEIKAEDSVSVLNTSVSSENRELGKYQFRLTLNDEIIAEKNFRLIPEQVKPKQVVPSINALINLGKGFDKKSGELTGIDSVFSIAKKGKVQAVIYLSNLEKYRSKALKFNVDWAGNDGKSFYRKEIEIPANDTTSFIKSSISITPETRIPGNFQVKVSLNRKVIGSKKFRLVQ